MNLFLEPIYTDEINISRYLWHLKADICQEAVGANVINMEGNGLFNDALSTF